MVKYGKEIFQDNLTQLTTIVVSLALAIVAQKLSGDVANMSLMTFLTEGYRDIMSSEHLSLVRHVLLPLTMYVLSCAFLLWMGVTNLVTYHELVDSSDRYLKISLGCIQLMIFVSLIIIGGKLFTYLLFLIFTAIILAGVLNFAATSAQVQK